MATYEESRKWDFNTAITALPESGEFDEKAHLELVRQLFARIKGQDGITRCYISRYGIEVYYMPSVINAEQAFEIVRSAVEWAAGDPEQKLFPIRGEKTPMVIPNKPAGRAPRSDRDVTARFNTNLTAFPTSPTQVGKYDSVRFAEVTHDLAAKLTEIDGITGYDIALNGVRLTFVRSRNTVEAVRAHMETVLRDAVGAGGIFPFISSSAELVLEFSVSEE